MPPPPPPTHHQSQPPPSPYAPPAEHWQQPPAQPQPPPQQQFNGYTRTTPLVPAPVETRAPAPPVPSPADAERVNARHQVIAEVRSGLGFTIHFLLTLPLQILEHCNVLYSFANHYGSSGGIAIASSTVSNLLGSWHDSPQPAIATRAA